MSSVELMSSLDIQVQLIGVESDIKRGDIGTLNQRVEQLYLKAKKNEIAPLSRQEILAINKRIYEIVAAQEKVDGNGIARNTLAGGALQGFSEVLVQQLSKLNQQQAKTSTAQTMKFKQMLEDLFSEPAYKTRERADALIEFLNSKPNFNFSIFSSEELQGLIGTLDTIKRKNFKFDRQGGKVAQFDEVTTVLILCKPILDDRKPNSNTIENAFQIQKQKESIQRVIDDEKQGVEVLTLKDVKLMSKQNILEVCLVAKKIDPEFLQLILDDAGIKFSTKERHFLGVDFASYIVNIEHALRSQDPEKVAKAIAAPHVKFNVEDYNKFKKSAAILKKIQEDLQKLVDETKLMRQQQQDLLNLQQEVNAEIARNQPKPHSPQATNRFAAVLPDFAELRRT